MNKDYIINVGKKGTFDPSKKVNTTPKDVDLLINNIRNKGANNIVLYFHGGLVNEYNGVAGAEFMNKKILNANAYPVSFVWETGLGETLRERIFDINETKLFKKLLKFVIKRVGSKLGLSLNARGFDQISDDEIESELNGFETPFEKLDELSNNRSALFAEIEDEESFINELNIEFERDFYQDEELMEMVQDIDIDLEMINMDFVKVKSGSGKRGIVDFSSFFMALAKIAFRVIKRHLQHRDHGFYPSVFEELLRELFIANFGSWFWSGMKEKADEMWHPNDGLNGVKQHAGTYFLNKLNEYAAERENFQINLLGHSAGSIAICNLLRVIDERYNNIRVNNVLFLAPACRSELFHKEVVLKPNRFEKFRMFTMNDQSESNDPLIDKLPRVYPRSLLYLISGILEDKGKSFDAFILGMERYFKWPVYTEKFEILREVKDFLDGENHRYVLSPTIGQSTGLNSTALDHGDFNENKETIESIMYIIKNA